VSTIDRFPQFDIRVTRNALDEDAGDIAAPEVVRAAAVPPNEAPASVTVDELGPGVWRLAGQSHNSVLFEFTDHLTLLEAPMNETRTKAVIARARELRPGKPLTHVIVTHHHYDHTGGLRAAVSEGLTIVAHESYEPLFRELVQRPHTVSPDAQARDPKPLAFQGVGDSLVLKDAMNEVALYNLSGNTHVQGLLMAYVPRERLLVQADVFGTYASYPFAPNLYEHLQKRRLRVERHVPIHGNMLTQADFMKVLPTAAGTN
jgi:glyoxylase-like metal-dependent hydrolase (beta-lactamase superfamily II)